MELDALTGEGAPHRVYGFERFGPPLPGTGRIIRLAQWEGGLLAVRQPNPWFPIQIYIWRHGEAEWEVIRVH